MLQLVIGNGKPLTNASAPIRWCVDKETAQSLKEQGIKNPQVLLIFSQLNPTTGRVYEHRELYPLDQLMAYISLQKPGECRVYGFIVWNSTESRKTLKQVLQKENKKYCYRILDITRNRIGDTLDYQYQYDAPDTVGVGQVHIEGEFAFVDINVPRDIFASYPEWLVKWVNMWHEDSPEDQCQFRRRFIFFLFPKMWIMIAAFLLNWVISVAGYAVLTFCGFTRLDHGPILHPVEQIFGKVFESAGHNWFYTRRTTVEKLFLVPLCPPILTALWWLGAKIATDFGGSLVSVALIATVVGFFWTIASIVYSSRFVKNKYVRKPFEVAFDILLWIAEKVDNVLDKIYDLIYVDDQMYSNESLVICPCEKDNLTASINNIPVRKRSLRLWYQSIKEKVCKPLISV